MMFKGIEEAVGDDICSKMFKEIFGIKYLYKL